MQRRIKSGRGFQLKPNPSKEAGVPSSRMERELEQFIERMQLTQKCGGGRRIIRKRIGSV